MICFGKNQYIMSKIYANKGVRRNKKPLRNILIFVKTLKELKYYDEEYEKFKFKGEYLSYSWSYQGTFIRNFAGFITPEDLKAKLTVKQWSKFCQGEREFVIQRRIDGHNI